MRLPDNQEPMMHKAGKYEVGKVADWEEAKQRQIRAILNKLTPTNFETLFQQVKAVNIDNVATLTGVVSQMVDRAIMEHTYCEMYVNLCFHLAMEMPDFNEDNEKITFKRVLLNKCQKEFERGERKQEEEANKADEEGEIKQSTEEIEEKRVEARRRMLGNIRLTGELYKKKMLTERIMHEYIQKFFGQYQDLDGEDVEALCKLMSTIGEMIDHEKAKEHMDTYFERMKTLSNNKNLSSRVRFMLKDSIELRKNKWQQRRKVEGPRKIEEVHRDAAQERQAQVSRLGHASSINRSARRVHFDFGPRGSTMLSSPNGQDVRAEERLSYEAGNQELMIKDLTLTNQLLLRKLKQWQWWFLVALNIFFLAGGQSAVVLIGRFYHDRGGNVKWMATLVQTAAFPILFIPLFLTPSSQQPSTSLAPSSNKILALIYFSLGVLISGNNMMYSVGLLYLPASTYSLICVSQLPFNAVFSYFINSQKFTASIINPVVVLSLSAALIAVNDDSEGPSGVSWSKYIIGLLCTLGASALYSLLLSLMQLSFQKVLKRETFSVVLEMQIYTSLVATCVSIAGLFASGEWKSLHGEMEGFGAGRVSYVMTLVWTAVAWQIYSVGVVGLIFVVSSLFANVVSTVSFAVTPIAFVKVFYDKMNGIKVIAMLLALWSFVSYIYQNYSDDSKASRWLDDVIESHNDYHKARRAQNDVSATNIQQKGLIPSPQTPLLMMHKAEKYEVGKVADEEEAKQRQLRAILNKLTPTNFEKLFEQVKAINIDNVVTLFGVVSQIFDRALMEPIYCEMYADFCCHLAMEMPVFNEDNKKITFKRVLVNMCQEEFERGEREHEEEANKADEEGEIKQFAEEREEKRVEARGRMLGNIGLIGELYKKKMLTERVMHTCIQKLLAQYLDLDGEDVEALCKLMSTIGEMIDHEKAKEHVDTYFERMKTLSNNKNLSSRARFMLKDAIDLRKNKWQQRKKVEGPKKIEEVHRDAAQERQAQVSGLGREGVSLSRQSLLTAGGATDASELKVESVGEGSTSVSSEISVPGIIVDTFETAHHAKLDESSLQNEELLHETVGKDEQGESKLPEVGFKQDVKSSEISSEPISLKSSELIKHTEGKQSGQDSDPKAVTTSDEVLTLETAQRGLAELVECHAEINGTTDFTDVGSSNGEKTSTLDVPSRSDSIGSKEVVTMSGISDQQSALIPTPDLLEAASKHEGEGAENFGAASVSKDKPSLDLSKAKITKGGKKTRKKKVQKANAAGTTSDLYNAYKGPEEKKETVASTESTESTSNSADVKQAPADAVEVDAIASEKGGTSKAEPDDWEDAADVSTPKLEVSDNGQEVIGRLDNHDGTTDFTDVGSSNGEKTSTLDVPSRSDLLEAASKHEGEGAENFGGGLVSFAASVSKAKITKGGKKKRKKKLQKADNAAGTTSDLYNAYKGPVERKETLASTESTESISHSGQQVIGRLDNHDKDEEVITAKKYSRDFLLKFAEQYNDLPKGFEITSDSEAFKSANDLPKGLIPSSQTPLLVMHKAEKKYEVGKVTDEEQAKQRQLKAILNKLTPQNFEKLFEQVKAVQIDNAATLTGVISQIFDKALMEPTFCEMYADFCCHLAGELPDFNEDNEKVTFKTVLLNKCQEEFERGEREQEEANKADEEGEIKQSVEEREEKRVKARRRMLGNIRLIGELYNKKMLTERIMHACIQKLLGQYPDPDEEDVEALCKLMSTIGVIIDNRKAKKHMAAYFDRMKTLSNNMNLSSRVRFMLKDAIDLRKNKWQQRRKVEGPKKIEEVHRDAAQEQHMG